MTVVPVDLAQLPPPDVVEPVSYAQIRDELIADLIERMPSLEPTLALESEPLRKLAEAFAYRLMLTVQRINDAARATMLAYARGSDLDHLAALFGVSRLAGEDDDRLRKRVQLTPDGWSVAGPAAAYRVRALAVSVEVRDALATSPAPGDVTVTVLATDGDGTPSPALLAAVDAALSADTVRPLTDRVTVAAPTIVRYQVVARLRVYPGPDQAVVTAAARAAVDAYVTAQRQLGRTVAVSGLMRALHQEGVERARLIEPTADISPAKNAAGYCELIDVAIETDGPGNG
ncbi:baseplate J/gp47 family protein (plasmid) [Tistrella mobilis]|uniref:baseplate assembly protein n=1 Tax=Tistrella mobilis TaxID=171437 RepID=UPI00355797DA